MINNTGSFSPLVSPDVTTKYYVSYADNFGCTAVDSVLVRVVDRVSLSLINDTTICRTDTVRLATNSDGLQYTWSPPLTLNFTNIQSPTATPTDPLTVYHVIARIGKCSTEDDIRITTVPYPIANAGPDSTICFGNSIQLNASGGSIYSWSPRIFLNNSNIANPVSQSPQQDVRYIVTVRDVLGCPKPVNDTMFLTVAKIVANAGPADTNVVLGQPLLLNATGSTNYEWTPNTWLNDPTIFNPVSLPQESIQYVVRVSNAQGCFDTDTINVKLFKIDPDLLVPSAFSPDNDGNNDVFRPIVIGMKSLDAFKVYNRWGQLMFSTRQSNNGWDGSFKGMPQSGGSYVWEAEGVTYLGRKVKKTGSVVLIR
jgi:gliding motility-associated-like protein